ncbi:MAG: 23S rRNA (adenine(1618)-N(6))-methyltransferase RlmF [Bacteroidota bacterium]
MTKQKPLKNELHPRNSHNARYDFAALTESCSELIPFVAPNTFGDESIDFANPAAVKTLNKALLKHFYNIGYWDLPDQYLCPPIPGRSDYLHYIADILASCNGGVIPRGSSVKGLDIGVGANCVYPLIGHQVYGWQFAGTDIDKQALNHAQHVLDNNHPLSDSIFLRYQPNASSIFSGIIHPNERFDFVLCNPPFHASAEEARQASLRKVRNLSRKQHIHKPVLNFSGSANELWCVGGEKTFIQQMVTESTQYAKQCLWFTSLVSKQTTLASVFNKLEEVQAMETKLIEMAQGQKTSRFIAWTFHSRLQQKEWRNKRWREVQNNV